MPRSVPTVSVVIPARGLTRELRECVPRILALSPPVLEILVAVDVPIPEAIERTRFLVPGVTGPAEKRDAAVREARGEILAFLDDDAYPDGGWLAAALPHFQDASVVAVGGPSLTPPDDPLWAQVSGAVFASWLGSGPTRFRHTPVGPVRRIDDWPTVNLLVRRDAFLAVGGFATSYWPGEDTKLCLDLIQRGGVILYDPAARCFHHRATTPLRHLRQVSRYGLHRGHFAKIFPETSRRFSYGLPVLATLGLFSVLASVVLVPATRAPLGILVGAVFLLAVAGALREALQTRHVPTVFLYPPLLLATHLVYGFAFLRGLLSPALKRYSRLLR